MIRYLLVMSFLIVVAIARSLCTIDIMTQASLYSMTASSRIPLHSLDEEPQRWVGTHKTIVKGDTIKAWCRNIRWASSLFLPRSWVAAWFMRAYGHARCSYFWTSSLRRLAAAYRCSRLPPTPRPKSLLQVDAPPPRPSPVHKANSAKEW